MPIPSHLDLRRISDATIGHYARVAETYREATWTHDVSQNVAALLAAIGPARARILDLGCGPGRDLLTFRDRGHEVVGLDGCAAFVAMAREVSGCEVWQQDMLALDLPAASFDGVFANAVLFHVPHDALPDVLGRLRAALVPGGVLVSSNPHGRDEEGWVDDRYVCFHAPRTWRRILAAEGFELLDEYYRPAGRPRREQPWFVTVARRPTAAAQGRRSRSRGSRPPTRSATASMSTASGSSRISPSGRSSRRTSARSSARSSSPSPSAS